MVGWAYKSNLNPRESLKHSRLERSVVRRSGTLIPAIMPAWNCTRFTANVDDQYHRSQTGKCVARPFRAMTPTARSNGEHDHTSVWECLEPSVPVKNLVPGARASGDGEIRTAYRLLGREQISWRRFAIRGVRGKTKPRAASLHRLSFQANKYYVHAHAAHLKPEGVLPRQKGSADYIRMIIAHLVPLPMSSV